MTMPLASRVLDSMGKFVNELCGRIAWDTTAKRAPVVGIPVHRRGRSYPRGLGARIRTRNIAVSIIKGWHYHDDGLRAIYCIEKTLISWVSSTIRGGLPGGNCSADVCRKLR